MLNTGLIAALVVVLVITIISNNDTNERMDKDFPEKNMTPYHSSNYVLIIGVIIGIAAIIKSFLG